MIQFLEKFIFIGNYPATVITRDDRQEIFRGKESKNCLKGKKNARRILSFQLRERERQRGKKKERIFLGNQAKKQRFFTTIFFM